MSYARWGTESDVYVFSDGVSYLCFECPLSGETYLTYTEQGMLSHLREHQDAGHKVPLAALERLTEEIKSQS